MLDWLRRQGLSQRQAQVVLGLGGMAVFVAFFLYVSLPLLEQIQGFGQQLPQFLEGGGEVLGPLGLILAIPLYVISRITFTGLYDYLCALQRHEFLLEQEESAKQHAAH